MLKTTLNYTLQKLALPWKNSLYRNSIYLITGNTISAISGFAFWAFATRYYSATEVGIASAVVSAMQLIAVLGTLGLQVGIIRYLPNFKERGNALINSIFTLAILVSIIFSIGFVFGSSIWSPNLIFLKENLPYSILFICFTAATVLSMLLDNIFIANRRAGLTTIKNLFFDLPKFILLIIVSLFLKQFGIIVSWGISLLISSAIAIFYFLPGVQYGYKPRANFKWNEITELIKYSQLNNISIFIINITIRLLPIFLLNLRGPEELAYFYIPWVIICSLSVIPYSISSSLLAEASHDENNVMHLTMRSLGLTMLFLVPVIVIGIIFASRILSLFGPEYARNADVLFQVLMLSLLPNAIYTVYSSFLRIRKSLLTLIILAALSAIVTFLISYWLLPLMSILGVGIGYLVGQLIIVFCIIYKERRFRLSRNILSGVFRSISDKV